MLLIVNSTPKSGSTWFYGFVRKCLQRSGHAHPSLTFLNRKGNPGSIGGGNLEALLQAASESTFAIKAHRPPNPELLSALASKRARSVFLIRHPVSMVRSALAYAEHCRARPDLEPNSPYTGIFTSKQAARFIEPFVPWANLWQDRRGNTVLRYEELFSDRSKTCGAAGTLMQGVHTSIIESAFEDLRADRLTEQQRHELRVNVINRPELDPGVVRQCTSWATEMGYRD